MDFLKETPGDYAIQHIAKQLFRAISSIGANIAEGHDSREGKEFCRYLSIAVRSAIESDHWLSTLENLTGASEDLKKLTADNIEVIKMVKGLRKAIEEKRTL